MKLLLNILAFTLGFFVTGLGQDSIRYRVIFIGDAGEMNATQQKALLDAADKIIPNKTTVMYLGDNIYPRGFGLTGSKEEQRSREILASQYKPMRAKGASVYFIPGNHDWDKMGPKGLAKIKRQWQFLEEQGDSLLKLIPANGCPDPVAIDLTDNLTIIAFDSEWWLYPFNKTNPDGDCDCATKGEVLARLDELRYKNRNKMILLASHHPFQSFGIHGGKYTWKDHIFPLASLNKNLYIPLPVIGSLYPLLRSFLANPEDLKHPLYKDMIKRVDGVFNNFPNLVHVAGHEHGLQFIKDEQIQVVSGAGAKRTNARQPKQSLFAKATQGYVVMDQVAGSDIKVTYYAYSADTITKAFTYTIPYRQVTEKEAAGYKDLIGDSIIVKVHPSYNEAGKLRRFLFGENYRKEWAEPVKLPVIQLSTIKGGLTPLQLGGGMQSKSLRLADKKDNEWVIRSVEKSPDALLPEGLRGTFAKDWLDDVTSAQHPFSALVVPPIANAVNLPHANPVIGVLAPSKNLGMYSNKFTNLVVLLEEREPLGKSDNSEKLKKNLVKDNDNRLEGKEFLRNRMLDMLLGDWDRHADQWRWFDKGNESGKRYLGVSRDRDQVFHVTEGVFPKIASKDYILPTLRNFDAEVSHVKWLMSKTNFVNAYPDFQINYNDWMKEAENFKKAVTDSVLEAALLRLPKQSYSLRHDVLLAKLKSRRNRVPIVMDRFYRFLQKRVDIQTTDKNELVQISDTLNGSLNIVIHKLSKEGEVKDELMNKTFDPSLTKEVRLFIHNGNDGVVLNNKTSPIRLRIIGGNDAKVYSVIASKNKVQLYDRNNASSYTGEISKIRKHLSNDSANTAFTPVNLYNVWMPVFSAGLNYDDGLLLGAGFKFTKQEGFRKFPYASSQQLTATHSFSTKAFRISYNGEWIHALGNADVTMQALARAPNNTINFFGLGNETIFNKTGNFKRFYRTRFNTYQIDPALRWRSGKGASVSIGPSFYYYALDADDNGGRFITNTKITSYDSLTYNKEKWHLGVALNYTNDKRSNKVLPLWGSYVNIKLNAYKGMVPAAKSFAQIIPEFAVYKSLNARSTLVLAERFGGTLSVGQTAFYQSAFIGGQENLLGYRQYRFAGQHSFYNNLELRIKVADVASYIVPGQFGVTTLWDIGRVWVKDEHSGKWHNGLGAGIYFAPASLIAFNFVMANSPEGWYPYFTMGLRF